MADIGIPSGGPRILLIKRHSEWVNLVNANCDSSKPRAKCELLHDLELWDRSQGRHTLNGLGSQANVTSVMRKDFDGTAWSATHESEFQDLISKARRKVESTNAEGILNELPKSPGPSEPHDKYNGRSHNQGGKKSSSDSEPSEPESGP